MPGTIDWKAKIEFLRAYKFVIAFENGLSPGYNTEKLTHAMEADSMPIYWGDPEIGWGIMPEFRGKGYAVEAAKRVREHGYGALKLPRLVSYIYPSNTASLRVAEKLGAKREGEFLLHGKNHHVYLQAQY